MKLAKFLKTYKYKGLSVIEEMEKSDRTIWVKDGFIYMYTVVDMKNGFKTVKDGFLTKADAKAFANGNYDYYIYPYCVKA